jgi:hypothetical protein
MASQLQMDQPNVARRFDGNWKVPGKLTREFLADGLGQELEAVADRILEVYEDEVDADEDGPMQVLAGDAKYPRRPGRMAAFLVIAEEVPGHQVATTIYLRRKGEDLFVRLGALARSRLRVLHWMFRGTLMASLFLLIYGLYFRNTGQREALIMEYARKQSPSDPGSYFKSINEGIRWDPMADDFVKSAEPMQITDVLREDPKLFLLNMSGPPTIILGALGVVVALIPAGAFDFISRFVGWPTVAEFNSFVSAEVAAADAVLRRILQEDFGVRVISTF